MWYLSTKKNLFKFELMSVTKKVKKFNYVRVWSCTNGYNRGIIVAIKRNIVTVLKKI